MKSFFGSRLLLLIAISLLVVAACNERQPTTAGELVVGMELAYPPFETINEEGAPVGVSVELAKALGESLGREVRIQNIPFDGLIPALKTGRIDLIISSMTQTEERDRSIDFSAPYVSTGLCLLVADGSKISNIDDLNRPERIVAVKKGTTGHVFATNNLPQAQLRLLDKETLCVLEVASGKADAFIYDQISVLRNWLRNKETTKPLLEPFQREYWAIGMREGEDDLRRQVDQFLQQYRAAGGFEDLAATYFAAEQEVFDQFGVPFVFNVDTQASDSSGADR